MAVSVAAVPGVVESAVVESAVVESAAAAAGVAELLVEVPG